MDLLLLAARLFLAAVFIISGFAKLADRAGSRQAMFDFGVPAQLAGLFGTLLPFAELSTAVLLIPRATAWWGGLAALALLVVFVAGIAANMVRGQAPDCHCFGQLSSEPVGWHTLIRNLVLILVAGLLLIEGRANPGTSIVGWLGHRTTADYVGIAVGLLLVLAMSVEGWLLLHLLQQNGRLLARVEALESRSLAGTAGAATISSAQTQSAGLPVGTVAPSFQLSGLHGETMTLEALRAAGKPTLLIFSDPHCGPCNALLPEIGAWQRDQSGKLTVALISRGSLDENRTKGAEHGLNQILLQQDREVAESYLAYGTPSAVVVREDGRIDSALAMGSEQIRQLVQKITNNVPAGAVPIPNGNGTQSRQASRIGTAAPDISLPDLSGKTVSLHEFAGQRALVLFWNPGCGFCQRMLDDLKAWEANRSADAPGLLVVSTGTAEANRKMGLTSTTVLDEGFVTGRAFGASGTPSAVMVDAQGNIASNVAVGAQAVMALAGSAAEPGKSLA